MAIAGILYLIVMFLTMGLFWPWLNKEAIITRTMIGTLVSGFGGGLMFILVMRYQLKKQKSKFNIDGDQAFYSIIVFLTLFSCFN